MKIAVASGKGGTGKTTVATNLAYVGSANGRSIAYLDCDVEEPNGSLFLKPEFGAASSAGILVPKVDESKCDLCGACGEICRFSAIAPVGRTVLVFNELCHGCGGCRLVCPTGAIEEVLHEIGVVRIGSVGSIAFVDGLLNVGQAMSPPVIKAVKAAAPAAEITIIDCPPGTSCPVIESLRGCDYLLLVTEPTPFGLNDLKLAAAMAREMRLPFGVVVNRAGLGDRHTDMYCDENDIEILVEIPDDRKIAEVYSRGQIVSEAIADYRRVFETLLAKIEFIAS